MLAERPPLYVCALCAAISPQKSSERVQRARKGAATRAANKPQ